MANCVMCGSPLPDSHKHKTCSMCYGDIDYGTDGYYREWAEKQERARLTGAAEERKLLDGLLGCVCSTCTSCVERIRQLRTSIERLAKERDETDNKATAAIAELSMKADMRQQRIVSLEAELAGLRGEALVFLEALEEMHACKNGMCGHCIELLCETLIPRATALRESAR